MHHPRARIIGGVRIWMEIYLFVRHARLPESLFRSACAGCRHIEHFDHRGAERGFVLPLRAEDVVGGDSPLTVRRAGKWDLRGKAESVRNLDGVADRVNVRVACLQASVDDDSSPFSGRKAGRFRQGRVRPDADGKNDEIRGEFSPVAKSDNDLRSSGTATFSEAAY